jgi:hypothetical protein
MNLKRIIQKLFILFFIVNGNSVWAQKKKDCTHNGTISLGLNPLITPLLNQSNPYPFWLRYDLEIKNKDRIYLQYDLELSSPLRYRPQSNFNSKQQIESSNLHAIKFGYMLFNEDGNLFLDFAGQFVYQTEYKIFTHYRAPEFDTLTVYENGSPPRTERGYYRYHSYSQSLGLGAYAGIGAIIKLTDKLSFRPQIGLDFKYYKTIKNEIQEEVVTDKKEPDFALQKSYDDYIREELDHNKNWIRFQFSLSYKI